MTKEFDLVQSFLTYATKPDKSNTDRRFLVDGTVNMLIDDSEKVSSRKGYVNFGLLGESEVPIESSVEWSTNTSVDRYLRGTDDRLEVYIGDIGDVSFNSWETLEDGFTSVAFSFDTYWDNTERIDRLIFCNGTTNQYDWSGGMATFASATTNTITIQGSLTAAQRRFLTSGTRQFRIKDTGGVWRTFTYTAGESTQTLTGVTGDPTAFTFDVGAPILQEVIIRANTPATTFSADFLRVINNQVHVGSRSSNTIYVSENDNIASFAFSSPRVAGEGALFTLDQPGRAIRVLRDFAVYFTKDYLYRSSFQEITVSTTLTETATVKRLKTAAQQGALSHELTAEVENGIAFITEDQELLVVEDVNNTEQPLISNWSDIIKPDFDAADFTNGHMFLRRNRLYISAPNDSRVFINETRIGVDDSGNQRKRRFWQPPQNLPVRRFANINNAIHGHSSIASETYTLFQGLRDRADLADDSSGLPILHRLVLANYNAGRRSRLKNMSEEFTEGYISPATVIAMSFTFEKTKGETPLIDKEIKGSNTDIVYGLDESDSSLGTESLGDSSLSGDDEGESLSKFRVITALNPVNFFDYELKFQSNDLDQEWKILATGPDVLLSKDYATGSKQ
jgi:hypothetical protein